MDKSLLYIYSIIILLTSCSSDLSKQEYVNWVQDPDNGLIIRKEIGDFAFELFYKPISFQVLQAWEDLSSLDEYKDTQHYTFKIESLKGLDVLKDGALDDMEYNNRLFYLSDYIQKDFRLIEAGDTLPCLFAHYERSYGLAPFAKVTLAFPATPESEKLEKVIQFNDPVFGAGKMNFNYSKSVLENIPNLKN